MCVCVFVCVCVCVKAGVFACTASVVCVNDVSADTRTTLVEPSRLNRRTNRAK